MVPLTAAGARRMRAREQTPPPTVPSCLPGRKQGCDHHLCTGDEGRKPKEQEAGAPEHHATTHSPLGFSEVKCPHDPSMGMGWVILYL